MNKTLYLAEREEETFHRHCRLSKILTTESRHIFDVGANIGQSISRYRDIFPGCFITSFEPNPTIFSQLEKNWGSEPGITLNRVALSDFTGHAPFFLTRVSEASSLLRPTKRMIELSTERKYDHETVKVPTMTLDRYCRSNNIRNIDVLKLDVQGAELSVLKGAKNLLKAGNVKIIYSEVIFAEIYTDQTRFIDLVSYLNKFNYDLWDIGSFLYTRNDRLWVANLTFIHVSAADFVETKKQQKEINNDSI